MSMARTEAELLLAEAGGQNPAPWVAHSRFVACSARRIAIAAGLSDPDRAYTMGLLHDIGRKNGLSHLKHATDGYDFLLAQGHVAHASVCLSHSFPTRKLQEYFGEIDISGRQLNLLLEYLEQAEYTDYDRLIQLCDHLASARGYCVVEQRMVDVALRYGVSDDHRAKWAEVLKIRQLFDEKTGESIYSLLPGIARGTFQTDRLLTLTAQDPECAIPAK